MAADIVQARPRAAASTVVLRAGASRRSVLGEDEYRDQAASLRVWAVLLLLRDGADPNAANRRGATPLHYACDPRPKRMVSGGAVPPTTQILATPVHTRPAPPPTAATHAAGAQTRPA